MHTGAFPSMSYTSNLLFQNKNCWIWCHFFLLYTLAGCEDPVIVGGKAGENEVRVFPGAQYWAYFLCAWPVCARWQVVCSGSGYRVIPAAVGHRKCSPGDWPWAQTASASDPAPPYCFPELNQNLRLRPFCPGEEKNKERTQRKGMNTLLRWDKSSMIYGSVGRLNSALGQTFTDVYFEARKYPCNPGDIWLTVCMLTAALFVISRGFRSNFGLWSSKKSLWRPPTPPTPPSKGWW